MVKKRKLKSSFHHATFVNRIRKEILVNSYRLILGTWKKKKPRKKCIKCNKRQRMKHSKYCRKCKKGE